MNTTNRKCLICQTEYYYCPSCEEARTGRRGFETWRVVAHDKNCRDILEILQKHSLEEITVDEAKEMLQKCDLSVLATAKESTKKHVDEIMGVTDNAPRRNKKKTVASVEVNEVNTQN